MKKILLFIIAALSACGNNNSDSDNKLTQEEQKNGWNLLFDGTTLNGWKGYKNKPVSAWSVKNGELVCEGSPDDKSDMRCDLTTVGEYDNFELSIDWKITPQSNSGIMYLVSEDYDAPWMTGPEYQIIDDENFPQKLEDWQKTAGNYAMNPPMKHATKPVGEWNNTLIKVDNGNVEHWLNGEKIVEYALWSPEWQKEKEEGKWKDYPSYGTVNKGNICLQDHGSKVYFKNLKIKLLQ